MKDTQAMERQSICFPFHGTQDVLQHGDSGFKEEIDRLYSPAENNALESLIALKASLNHLSTEDFWTAATEGISSLLGAEICFIMKRILVDDQESAVEMPPLGEPGSCMMAAALHYCGNDGTKETYKSTRFHAYGCPCAYMRHDKVFVIPDRLNDFITNNPNQLPTPCEAYIAVPLFEQGKCFGHFGAMWSAEGAAKRKLSWAFIETIMHAMEDMIAQRFSAGANLVRAPAAERSRVIPHDVVTLAQSLRPYAGSLSHELRTPMQGIVGMLDVMYATVQDAVEGQNDPTLRKVFETLKANIEIVQDSSRRAVEAADNVVHAYDMDMAIPEAPPTLLDEPSHESHDSMSPAPMNYERRPEILVAGSNLPLSRPNKRRREEAFSRTASTGSMKAPRLGQDSSNTNCRCAAPIVAAQKGLADEEEGDDVLPTNELSSANELLAPSSRMIAPGLRHTNLGELVQSVINDSLKVGGRPDSAFAQETELGEIIEVRTRGSDGSAGHKNIEWSIDPSVPSTLFIDEKDLSKLISCLILNAIKFTDAANGRITVHATMSRRSRYISIKVSDNGQGIPAAFLPKLFKPFSQENASTTRSNEGLGLGLMVAKGIARKLGGDLMCTRAETSGMTRGTDFEIKIPLQAGETISRPGSPFSSPMPRQAQLHLDSAHIRPLPPAPSSPRGLSRALHDAVGPPLFYSPLPGISHPRTPPSPKHCMELAANVNPPIIANTPPSPTSSNDTAPRPRHRRRYRKSVGSNAAIDRDLATKYPLNFLVAEDNKINRKLLVSMLSKFGYKNILEAHDGTEAVRQMSVARSPAEQVDVVLMDLWMPLMDGYEATQRILGMDAARLEHGAVVKRPTVLAVTADVTDGALERAAQVGMKGYMTKPYKLMDLQRLITEYCARSEIQTQESENGNVESVAQGVTIEA
ncbi:unnamed protein product [Zymoseptoria tritici ST99CH_3D1]|nr:unnamed protein product [Zymoseptoria tritici ST99CH_3D1]